MITKEQIQKASEIAEAQMLEKIKTLDGARLGDWVRFWNSIKFTPNKLKGGK